MKVEKLKYSSWDELPQCGVQRVNRYSNDKPSTDYQCSHKARYRIDGQNMCTKHAGVASLAFMLKHYPGDNESEFEIGG